LGIWGTLLGAGRSGYILTLLFLIPFLFYPHKDLRITFLVTLLIYGIGMVGLKGAFKKQLTEYRYTTPDLSKYPYIQFQGTMLSWPQKQLFQYKNITPKNMVAVLVWSGFFAWWYYLMLWGWEETREYSGQLFWFALVIAIVRILLYTGKYSKPISWIGRLLTGRFIVPKYDVVFAAPILIVLMGIAGSMVCGSIRSGRCLVMPVIFFLLWVMALGLGPSKRKWVLTGGHQSPQRNTRREVRGNKAASSTR
jgi:hypothetical protein